MPEASLCGMDRYVWVVSREFVRRSRSNLRSSALYVHMYGMHVYFYVCMYANLCYHHMYKHLVYMYICMYIGVGGRSCPANPLVKFVGKTYYLTVNLTLRFARATETTPYPLGEVGFRQSCPPRSHHGSFQRTQHKSILGSLIGPVPGA